TGWSDVVSGAIAGTMAGVAAAVTVACLLTLVDWVPRYLLEHLFDGNGTSSAWLWTPIWIVGAVLWWGVGGAGGGGGVAGAGQRGRAILSHAALPLSYLLQMIGLKRAADAFAMH